MITNEQLIAFKNGLLDEDQEEFIAMELARSSDLRRRIERLTEEFLLGQVKSVLKEEVDGFHS